MTQAANRENNLNVDQVKNYSFHLISSLQASIIPYPEIKFDLEIVDELNDVNVKEQFRVSHVDVDFEVVLASLDTDTFLKLGNKIKEDVNPGNSSEQLSDILKLINSEKYNKLEFKIIDVDGILDGNPLI